MTGPLFSFPPANQLNPQVSERMAEVIACAVALAPSDRYASAAEFRAALLGLSARRLRAMAFGTRSAPTGRRALAVMAAVLLVPLMLSQMLRIAQLPLQNGYYPTSAAGDQAWPAPPSIGSASSSGSACTPSTAMTAAQTGSSVCGPDGTVWALNSLNNAVDHTWADGKLDAFTMAHGNIPPSASLVAPSQQASQCNCVWLVDDQGMQVRLNANGQTARVPLPVSILANVSSGLLRTTN